MLIYATEQDLAEWPGGESVTLAGPLLRSASSLVTDWTITALYDTDEEGYPTDPEVRSAFRDATLAQVMAWDTLGIDPRKGSAGVTQKKQVSSKAIGSATISYDSSGRSVQDMVDAVHQLDTQAVSILRGVLPHNRVRVVG